jgi:hypothetical protein
MPATVLTGAGRRLGVVVCEDGSVRVEDCDEALVLLRRLARTGSVEERRTARDAIDDVLDHRNELLAAQAEAGTQS